MKNIGNFAVPIIIFAVVIFGLVKKQNIFTCFCEGATDGLKTARSLVPPLCGLIVAVSLFKASGALDVLVYALSPITDLFGIPADVMPLSLLRPISGSGTLSLLDNLLTINGPDSFVGRLGCVLCGSTDTTFYATAVYFGSVGVKNIRHTLLCGVTADIVSFIASIITVSLFFY